MGEILFFIIITTYTALAPRGTFRYLMEVLGTLLYFWILDGTFGYMLVFFSP